MLALAVYWPALRGQFVWDDTLLIDRNPLVKGELGLRSVWFQTDFPLTMIGFWVQWLAWGKNPAGYHAVNVILHATSAVLVWRVLARLKIAGPWLAATLFAVHPVCRDRRSGLRPPTSDLRPPASPLRVGTGCRWRHSCWRF